mgnify:CR=1 FL=1
MLDTWLREIFVKRFGEGEPNQADFYRCQSCAKLRTWRDIRAANLCCQGRLVPANPTAWETVKVFVFPWMV